MNIQLIQGGFSPEDAVDLISQMIQTKIKFHEGKIARHGSEEDIKYRESKIKRLQQELNDLRNSIYGKNGIVKLDAVIHIGE